MLHRDICTPGLKKENICFPSRQSLKTSSIKTEMVHRQFIIIIINDYSD